MRDVRDIVYDALGVHYLRTTDVVLCRKNEREPFAQVLAEGKTVLKVGHLDIEDQKGIFVKIS